MWGPQTKGHKKTSNFSRPDSSEASMRISLAFCLLAAPASALLATRPVPSQPTQRARLPRMQEAADFEKLRFENLKLKKEVRNIPSR